MSSIKRRPGSFVKRCGRGSQKEFEGMERFWRFLWSGWYEPVKKLESKSERTFIV
jgi:hypothetical protein